MKIMIENYRGFDIEFDTDYEKFQCIVTDEDFKESKSFSAVKKFVDDYKKTNQGFKSFFVERIPEKGYGNDKILKIIGLRKDNRFVAKSEESGKNIQISDYNLSDYMLKKDDNKQYFQLLNDLELKYEAYRNKYVANKKEIIAKFDIVNLKDYKKLLMG